MSVGAIDHERAAGSGPEGAVGSRSCLVDVCAWIDPLAGWFFEGRAAPDGLHEAEMCVYAQGEGEDCEKGSWQRHFSLQLLIWGE